MKRITPGFEIPDHGIENDNELVHASDESDLLLFAALE